MDKKESLLLGLGNDLRGDDRIGFDIIEYIKKTGFSHDDLIIETTLCSGISLLTTLCKYKNVFIVDAVSVPDEKIGNFWILNEQELSKSEILAYNYSLHSMNPGCIADLLRKSGETNPELLKLFLVGIKKKDEFVVDISTEIDEKVLNVIPNVSQMIINEVNKCLILRK